MQVLIWLALPLLIAAYVSGVALGLVWVVLRAMGRAFTAGIDRMIDN